MSIGHPCSEEKKKRLSVIYRGKGNPNWQGNTISEGGARHRTRNAYPSLGICERCEVKSATERHHKNGIISDTRRSNIRLLCRVCHMTEDGRIEKIRERHRIRIALAAYLACGNERWRKCKVCHQWDDPKNLCMQGRNVYHRRCHSERMKRYNESRKEDSR